MEYLTAHRQSSYRATQNIPKCQRQKIRKGKTNSLTVKGCQERRRSAQVRSPMSTIIRVPFSRELTSRRRRTRSLGSCARWASLLVPGGAGAAGKMAGAGAVSVSACRRWGWAAVSFGLHRGLREVLARPREQAPQWLPGKYRKAGVGRVLSYALRSDHVQRDFGASFKNAVLCFSVPQS